MKRTAILLSVTALLTAAQLSAKIVEKAPAAFKVTQVRHVAVPPDVAWRSLVHVEQWWSGEHTYSGDAANMKLDARPGGCWCETLPNGGGVVHMTVVYVVPNQRLTLSGGLGPLQTAGVSGAMTLQVTPKEGGTDVALMYNVGGYYPGGLDSVAGGVDEVLTEQFDRLARLIATGSAEAKPAP
ncbi:MAG TPA: SRPBCC family protein [Thermoanaerobaculia bacterium]|jgi:uncharacterized protein YndB with AHSA1/START domain